jgi:predicted lipid-binding transport protein (Tim44 family)
MESLDLTTLFFIGLTIVVLLQLRSVLGKRTGIEKKSFDPFVGASNKAAASGKTNEPIITLVKRNDDLKIDYSAIDCISPPNTDLNTALRALKNSDASFDPAQFIRGAKVAYETIVIAFAKGDRAILKNMLSKDVLDGFTTVISEREERGEVMKSNFVGISKMDIIDAELKDMQAHLTLKIVSQLISATFDKDGHIIDGDMENVADVKDIWTFARDTHSIDPNWKLVETEAEN